MQSLRLANNLFPAVLDGSKRGTIRIGRRDIALGLLLLEAAEAPGPTKVVEVLRVSYTRVKDLTVEDREGDGYDSMSELFGALKRFYPNMCGTDEVTVIRFTVVH